MAEVKLRVTTSTGQQTLDGDQEYVVGRGREADVPVTGGHLSRRHVLLVRGPGGWVATDASANGMWRGGERVTTAAIGDGEVTLHLGAADGPEIALLAIRPEPPARPAQAPSPATLLGAAETVMAPGAAPAAPPPPGRPAAGPAGQPERYRAPVPAQSVPAQPVPQPSPAPSPLLHWLRVVPTLIWLLATGFALGALLALS